MSTFEPISARAVSKSIRLRSSVPFPVRTRKRSTEWWRVSRPSSSRVSVAWNSKGGAGRSAPWSSESSERFLDSGEVREHPVQGGQLEDHPHLLIGGCQPEVAFRAAHQLECSDDRAQPRAVDKAHAFEVDHDPWRAILDRFGD